MEVNGLVGSDIYSDVNDLKEWPMGGEPPLVLRSLKCLLFGRDYVKLQEVYIYALFLTMFLYLRTLWTKAS